MLQCRFRHVYNSITDMTSYTTNMIIVLLGNCYLYKRAATQLKASLAHLCCIEIHCLSSVNILNWASLLVEIKCSWGTVWVDDSEAYCHWCNDIISGRLIHSRKAEMSALVPVSGWALKWRWLVSTEAEQGWRCMDGSFPSFHLYGLSLPLRAVTLLCWLR